MAPKKKLSGQILPKSMIMGPKFLKAPNTFSKVELSNIKDEETPKIRPSVVIKSTENSGESLVEGEGEDKGEDFIPKQARQRRSQTWGKAKLSNPQEDAAVKSIL